MSAAIVHDVVIVGGSFAGLSAAAACARRGLRVLVLERQPHAGAAVHTTGLLCPDTAELLDLPAELLGRRLDALDLVARSGVTLRVARPCAGFLPTRTASVLAELSRRAIAAGAEVRHGVRVDGVREESGCVLVRAGRESIVARHVIAADGARSAVARSLGLGVPRGVLAGREEHVECPPHARGSLPADACLLLLDRHWAPGYACYAFASVDGTLQVGALGVRRGGWRPDAALEAFKAWLSKRHGIRWPRACEARGGLVPVSGARSSHGRLTAVIGDAAAHVSPLSAGGIGRAARAGELVAGVLERGPAAWREALAPIRARSGGPRSLLRAGLELSLVAPAASLRFASLGPVPALVEAILYRRHGLALQPRFELARTHD